MQAVLPGVAMQDNIFDDDNGIIDDQPHGCGKAAQCHEVETLTKQLQGNECDRNCDGNHQSRHDRSAPVPEKND